MRRILVVAQETGGIGKSTCVRGLAEAVPDAAIVEVESTHRLLDLDGRVDYFRVRADREEVEASGGEAAQAEFDAVGDHLVAGNLPTIVDIGANASHSLLTHIGHIARAFKNRDCEIGVLVVVANEPGAIADAARLVELVGQWCTKLFVMENQLRGTVDPVAMNRLAESATRLVLARHVFSKEAQDLLQSLGLASITRLDDDALEAEHGPSKAMRIKHQLESFRLDVMKAVRAPAEWLIG